jgi:hypothetical protein
MEEVNRNEQLSQVHNEALQVLKKKIIGYEDAFADYGTAGVIVRIGDKIQRLVSVTNMGISLVNTKILRDTLIDLHNYAALAIISIDKTNNKISQIQKDQNFDLKIENLG